MNTYQNKPIMVKNDEVRRALHDISRAHRILDLEGHNDMSLGHLSYRDPWNRGLWLKRGNIGLEEVGEEDFILIDLDGEVLGGEGVRHLEWPIHAEIMRARPELMAVGHTHPLNATVLGCTGETLRPYTNEGVWFAEPPPRYMTTSDLIDSPELGRDLAKRLGRADGIFLRNHGVCFVGKSIKEMCLAGIFLEKAARAQLMLAQSGLKHSYPDAAEIEKKRRTIYPQRAIDNFWDYYNRKLDRLEAEAE